MDLSILLQLFKQDPTDALIVWSFKQCLETLLAAVGPIRALLIMGWIFTQESEKLVFPVSVGNYSSTKLGFPSTLKHTSMLNAMAFLEVHKEGIDNFQLDDQLMSIYAELYFTYIAPIKIKIWHQCVGSPNPDSYVTLMP